MKKTNVSVADMEKLLEEQVERPDPGSAFARTGKKFGKRKALPESVVEACKNARVRFMGTGKAVVILDTVEGIMKATGLDRGAVVKKARNLSTYPNGGGLALSGEYGHYSLAQTATCMREGQLLKVGAEIREVPIGEVLVLNVLWDYASPGLKGEQAKDQLETLKALARGNTMKQSGWEVLKQVNPELAKAVHGSFQKPDVFVL